MRKMKNITTLTILLLLAAIAVIFGQSNPTASLNNQGFPSGCTVITIAKGDRVFFGGNDDYINPDSYYWVDPGDSARYGVIWIGTPDNPQQGVNEKCLAYDSNGLPRIEVNPHPERIPVQGKYYHQYIMQIMHECASVIEVMEWVNTHQRFPYMHDQLHFADKTGDAVIISAGKDGEMCLTRKSPGDGFLVSTNFNVANPANSFNYPCWRYDEANEMLNRCLEKAEPLTLQEVVNVMDAVHQEKPSWTVETIVADLVHGVVYLYYFYQFDRPVVLNVKAELLNPRAAGPLSQLFPEDVRQEAAKRFNQTQASAHLIKRMAYIWLVLVVLGVILFFSVGRDPKKGLKFWLPLIVVLGPFALVSRWIVLRKYRQTFWGRALIETLMDTVPLVVSYTLAITILVISAFSGKASSLLQISLMFGLPLVAGLFYHASLLYSYSAKGLGKFMASRAAQVLVSTFMGLGGMSSLAMPMINKNLVVSLIMPLSPLAVISWWALVTMGAVAGGLFIFFYEYWAVRSGYAAWNVLSDGTGQVTTPGWRKLWWWLPISVVVLFLGLVVGIRLTK